MSKQRNGEKSLEELKKLAKPALLHEALVHLAQTCCPGRVVARAMVELAFPRRPAQAARWLAVLKRDYPQEFDLFISETRKSTLSRNSGESTLGGELRCLQRRRNPRGPTGSGKSNSSKTP